MTQAISHPMPSAGEAEAEYLKRFMSDDRMISLYPDERDRTLAAKACWEKTFANEHQK
jgi:hypothetical protein